MPVTGLNDEPATRVQEISSKVDGVKPLELAFNFGPTYSTTFNMGGVAIVFGLF